jgi:phenylalanyl-tRNA synthetase beta chain
LKISNSSVSQFDQLRNDLLPNVIKIIYDNRKNYDEIKIFEMGRVFQMKDGILSQPKHLMAAVYSSRDEEQAYRYIKGICSNLLSYIKNTEAKYISIKDMYKENCLSINYNDIRIGYIYSVPAAVLKIFNSKNVINILDIDLQLFGDIEKKSVRYEPVSKYPETYLDFSILTSIDEPYYNIESLVNKFENELIIQTDYIDTYIGKNIPENIKSTTFRVTIGSSNRTLQVEEINELKELFISYLGKNGLRLR